MHIEFTPSSFRERQVALNEFSREVKTVVRQNQPRSFNHEQLVLILLELAKNTWDHSDGVGSVDIRLPTDTESLLVVYRDTGAAFDWDRHAELGVSSKSGNGINFGLGLSIISQGSFGMGLQFNLFRTADGTEFRFEK